MTRDRQLIESPGPAAGDDPWHAWLSATLSIGDELRGLRADQERHHRLVPDGTDYPLVQSGIVSAGGTVLLDLGTPSLGREWTVRRLVAVDAANPSGQVSASIAVAHTRTGGPGEAHSAILPNGASITGFNITTAPAAATEVGVVNLIGVGTNGQSFQLPFTTTGSQLAITFPQPLAATNSTTGPELDVPAVTGGSAYTVNSYGIQPGTGATPGAGFWYAGLPSIYGPQTAVWKVGALPDVSGLGSGRLTVVPGDHLFLSLTGCTPGDMIVARADVDDHAPYGAKPVNAL